MHLNVTIKNVSWPHISWPTLYMLCVAGAVRGVTYLDNIMYVICRWSSTIHLYNMDTYSPLDVVINIGGMDDPLDIVVCRHDRQLFVADNEYSIWRVSVDDYSYERWLPSLLKPDTVPANWLSLTSRRLLVTLWSRTLHQYSTVDKKLLRVLHLLHYVQEIYHAVETTRQTFVVSHRGTSQDDEQNAVSEIYSFCHQC